MSNQEMLVALLEAIQSDQIYVKQKLDTVINTMATKEDLKPFDKRVSELEVTTDEMKSEVTHYTKVKRTITWLFRCIVAALVTAGIAFGAAAVAPHPSSSPTPAGHVKTTAPPK